MIDIHSHILYGVDDGAKTVDESLAMIKACFNHGINILFLTPHVAPKRGYMNTDSFIPRFNELKKLVKKEGISIKLLLGAEIDYSNQLEAYLKPEFSMNQSGVYMVDFGISSVPLDEIIYELSVKKIPIILAHPERYFYSNFELLKKVKEVGGMFQVSAANLLKGSPKKVNKLAKKLLKEDMIDFIGSDAHHSSNNLEAMELAYRYVVKKKGKQVANDLFYENAKRVLMIDDA